MAIWLGTAAGLVVPTAREFLDVGPLQARRRWARSSTPRPAVIRAALVNKPGRADEQLPNAIRRRIRKLPPALRQGLTGRDKPLAVRIAMTTVPESKLRQSHTESPRHAKITKLPSTDGIDSVTATLTAGSSPKETVVEDWVMHPQGGR